MNEKEFKKTMGVITDALSSAGYNVREQLTAFLLTGDATYITRRNNARILIKTVDKEQLRCYINELP